jgi:hypothetical protein
MLRRSTRSGANTNQGAVKQGRGVIRPAPEANAKQAAAPANRPRASPRGAALLAPSGRLSAQTVSVTTASGPSGPAKIPTRTPHIIAKPHPANPASLCTPAGFGSLTKMKSGLSSRDSDLDGDSVQVADIAQSLAILSFLRNTSIRYTRVWANLTPFSPPSRRKKDNTEGSRQSSGASSSEQQRISTDSLDDFSAADVSR